MPVHHSKTAYLNLINVRLDFLTEVNPKVNILREAMLCNLVAHYQLSDKPNAFIFRSDF